ncbi:1,2-phenylacetyl-CoA epoxidase subunit PaaC [Streptomyces sp. NPDC049040]|uniref:1,2-phenylacetyl-CoA epoxidase subunit PaaC n=1 Tax=Streptomyces sp. NPDC049040 TaxID=3365593 RepID=UPI003721137B
MSDATDTSDAADDHVYLSLAEQHDSDGEARWAFGTGFEDPLHGVDTEVPAGVDTAELAALCLALADDALVGAQRLAQWCTRAPELEEEVALANIGLDLLGQARLLYARCGQVDGTGRGEDAYAYSRDAGDFRSTRLAELPDSDFASCVVRLLVLSTWRLALFTRLASAPDPVLAAVAAKGVPELAYHRQYAADWAVRLGDGTEESNRRMRAALEAVAPFLAELLDGRPEIAAADTEAVRQETLEVLDRVLSAAGLGLPPAPPGPSGPHTDHLTPLLAELQSVARAFPGATW